MNAAELMVQCLVEEGVRYVFGVPGEENSRFLIALNDSPIRFIVTRHEQGAAFMADVFGRLTGEAGVCLGTLGPGATNLTTGVADANLDRAPLVSITGQADTQRQHKESHQHINVVRLFRAITKWATPITHPDNVPEIVRKAFKLATEEKPGACHIEIAEDIAEQTTQEKPLPKKRIRRPVPDAKSIEQAFSLIREAKEPIILAGNGTIRKRASRTLRIFCEKTGISVVNTFMGKGAVSRQAPYCLFTIGLQARDYVTCAIEASDLVITLGYDLVEYNPIFWNPKRNKKIIHIDFLSAEVDENYQVDVEVVGDIASALEMLNARLEKEPIQFKSEYHQQMREKMLEEFSQFKDDHTKGTIRPQKVLWDVRQVMGPWDIVLSDVGAHKLWVARYYQCDEPNTCLIPNGLCPMGFALPGAIAAKMIYPDRRILAICGDGGFLMNVQEMETAARLKTRIVVMVWEDKDYGLISWKMQNEYGRHIDFSFDNPDFCQLAASFGWKGMQIQNSADLKKSLEKAFSYDQPCLISIPIDYRENSQLSARLGNIVCPI